MVNKIKTTEYKSYVITKDKNGCTIEDQEGFLQGFGKSITECEKYIDQMLDLGEEKTSNPKFN